MEGVEFKGERIVDEGAVERTKEEVELVPKEEAKPVPWRYRHFIEGVAAEDIAQKAGADPSRMARVFAKKDAEGGKDQVHIVGSPDVVKEVANGLESPRRELHTWYIGEAETVDEERAVMRPALAELLRGVPPAIGTAEDIIREAKGLPLVETPALTEGEAAKELGEALEGFSPGKQTREELKGEGED